MHHKEKPHSISPDAGHAQRVSARLVCLEICLCMHQLLTFNLSTRPLLPSANCQMQKFWSSSSSEETDSSSSGSSEREETHSDISDSMTSTDESEEDPGKDNLAYAKTLLILGLSLGS